MPFIEHDKHKGALPVALALLVVLAGLYIYGIQSYNRARDITRDLHSSFVNVEQAMQARYEYIESIFNKIAPTEQGNELYLSIMQTRMRMFSPARTLDERVQDANAAERAVWALHEYIRHEPRTADMSAYAGLLNVERRVLEAYIQYDEAHKRFIAFRDNSFMSDIGLSLAGTSGSLHDYDGPLLFTRGKAESGGGRGDL